MALLELVHEQAVAAQATRVTRLVLEIGTLSHVDVHALRFAVEVAAQGGLAKAPCWRFCSRKVPPIAWIASGR